MNKVFDEVLQHLNSSLSIEFDYSNVDNSLDFLFRKSYNGKKILKICYSFLFTFIFHFYHTKTQK